MPITHKKDGWYWGGRGPFKSRKKAVEVAQAAYASGYVKKSWKSILKIESEVDGRKVRTSPEESIDFLTYRSWAWQSKKARESEGMTGGFKDKEHLELITTPKGKALGYDVKGDELKRWIRTWNAEFGEKLGAIYPTGDE